MADDIAKTATTAMSGDAASFILQQDRLIKVRVIFPADVRTSLDKVKALQVRSSSGQLLRIDARVARRDGRRIYTEATMRHGETTVARAKSTKVIIDS